MSFNAEMPQVRDGVAPTIKGSLEDTSERERGEPTGEKRETAAQRIQRWYRSCQRERQRERLAELRSLLREKKTELDCSLSEQLSLSLREVGSEMERGRSRILFVCQEREKEEKRRRRQEKMVASRQAAILSLQQKREERKREGERIAREEIVS